MRQEGEVGMKREGEGDRGTAERKGNGKGEGKRKFCQLESSVKNILAKAQ